MREKKRGKLYVVGIGPGKQDLLTLRAREVLSRADVILGHRTYVRRILDVINPEAEVIESSMGKELERVRLAVELSKDKVVCLVSGGDPSIYGMASLVFEYVVKNNLNVEFEVVPGVTALSAASPLLGCPVSGDHCVISLSDLLTPWEVIERRLISALLGDFVLVIYNPSSRRRKDNLRRAMELVLRFRGDVAVGCVRNAERDVRGARDDRNEKGGGTRIWITRPSELIEEPESVDMHTILFVSNFETQEVDGKLLTPRGYSNKYDVCERHSNSENKSASIASAAGAKTPEGMRIAESSARIAENLVRSFRGVERFVAERCFVATADVSVLNLLAFNRADEVLKAVRECRRIIVDVEMVRAGIEGRARREGKEVISAVSLARSQDREKTLAAAGMRECRELLRGEVVAIGNAPSALEELCRIMDRVKPKAVIATPVGFTNAARAKEGLMKKDIPWIVVRGARGGSTLCAAIVNALLAYQAGNHGDRR